MKISTLKTIGVASVATVMFVGVAHAQQELSEKQKATVQRIENALESLILVESQDDDSLSGQMESNLTPRPGPFNTLVSGIDGISTPADVILPGCEPLPQFNFIGVDDQGLSDSQFFKMNLTVPMGNPEYKGSLGSRHNKFDLEGLDSSNHPGVSCLWASSGDNDGGNPLCKTGCLYRVDKTNADLTLVGDICTKQKDLVEVDALAFRLNQNLGWEELWGWAQAEGLFRITAPQVTPNLCGTQKNAVRAKMRCKYQVDEPTNEPNHNKFSDLVVEDMTWAEDEGVFYVAIDQTIFTINPKNCKGNFVCVNQTEIEALEYLQEHELVVVGFHNPDVSIPDTSIAALEPSSEGSFPGMCQFLPSDFPSEADVEGLAYP